MIYILDSRKNDDSAIGLMVSYLYILRNRYIIEIDMTFVEIDTVRRQRQ
jgi:hypothetical protein